MKLLEWLDRRLGTASTLLAFGSATCALLMMAFLAADVAYRFSGAGSIPGVFELVDSILVLMVYLGVAYAERVGAHVRVTTVTSRVGTRLAVIFRLFGSAAAIIVVAWAAYATSLRALESVLQGEYRMGLIAVPVWPGRVAVALGFSLLTLELMRTGILAYLRYRLNINGNYAAADGRPLTL